MKNVLTNTEIQTSLPDMFTKPIASKKVRKYVTAYKYGNGIINIAGMKYSFYSMNDAIKLWRKANPIN